MPTMGKAAVGFSDAVEGSAGSGLGNGFLVFTKMSAQNKPNYFGYSILSALDLDYLNVCNWQIVPVVR